MSSREYRCTYVASDPLNPEKPKLININGTKAEALFVAMQHAKVKYSCEVEPKYLLEQSALKHKNNAYEGPARRRLLTRL